MEYGEFLGTLQPVTLGLNSASCSLNREAYWSQEDHLKKRVLSSKYALSDIGRNYFDIEASFSVSVQLEKGDGAVVHALKIDCVFGGHFHTKDQPTHDDAQKFATEDAWLLFWPFFRQFVSDTTSRMSIPPLVVPLALGEGEYVRQLPPTKDTTRRSPKKGISGRAARTRKKPSA